MNIIPTGRKLLSFADNKKTYFGCALIVLDGVLASFGHPLPNWMLMIVGGGTLAAHRAAITKVMYAIQWGRLAEKELMTTVTEPETPNV